jgi:hypothetical protein
MHSDDILKRINAQYESVSRLSFEELEAEYKYVLENMINSNKKYNELYGYYFSVVVELYSRCVLEDTKNRNKLRFNSLSEYRESLQKIIEEE